ncbi:MAG TPA: hypothetical protein VGO58_00910 [Chitinophagaceae bacterium]|jgi:hypothetical protein|nr:hypothetical protein [Chitinophagaceae bacterium]
MKTLNLKSLVAVLLIATFALVSCKKENVPPPQASVAGVWEGKYSGNQDPPSVYFAFDINPNGTMIVKAENKNNPMPGTGTWTLNGDNFKAIYSYDNNPDFKLIIAAKYDAVKGELNGSWGEGEVIADDGAFYMNKQ